MKSIYAVRILIVDVVVTCYDVTFNIPISESIEKIRAQPVRGEEVDILTSVYEISEMDDRLDLVFFEIGKESTFEKLIEVVIEGSRVITNSPVSVSYQRYLQLSLPLLQRTSRCPSWLA